MRGERYIPIVAEQEKHLNNWDDSPFSLVMELKYCNLSSVLHDRVLAPCKYHVHLIKRITRIFYTATDR